MEPARKGGPARGLAKCLFRLQEIAMTPLRPRKFLPPAWLFGLAGVLAVLALLLVLSS